MTAESTAATGLRRATALAILAGVLLALGAAPPACADSLWDRRDGRAAFLFSDNLAADVGDSITVVIADESSFTKKGERELEKTSSSSGSVNINTKLVDLSIPAGNLSQESSRKLEGSNEYTSSREFVDSITCTVIDRLPNDNMVIAGRSSRTIADEDVVTILTGIIRPEDVSASNSVSSMRVAHLSVYYETKDDVDAYMNHGWLNKIINILWPF